MVDAHEQIDRVIEICGDDAHTANVTLVSQLKAEDHHIDADPARFQQILWNLLKNAIKFSQPSESIVDPIANSSRCVVGAAINPGW